MSTKLSRRDWFRSSLALTGGVMLSTSLAEQLMAAPVSKAEMEYMPFALPASQLIRLGSNENPYGPSPKARAAIQAIMSEGNRYADDQSRELRELIAKYEGVSPDYIFVGAGSAECLCLTGMAVGLEGASVLSAFPTFRLLMDYAVKFKARWDRVDLDQYLVHNLDAMASAVKSDTKIMFLCNPNNPTGTVLNADRLKSFCVEMAKKTTVYVDEAYLELLEPNEQVSMASLVKEGHNVIVSRTFSKVYGLAGLRVGYVVAPPDVVKRMANYQMGPILNQAGLAAAKASLGDKEFASLTRQKNNEAMKFFTDYLDKKKYFYGKSRTNCILFPAPKDGKTILAETEKRGFQIRVWDYQGKEWCRVSIGTLEEMKLFVKAFDEVIA